MDLSFRFLVIAATTYMVFLCVIRLVLGSQYKSKSFLINFIGMITVYGSFLISRYANLLKLPTLLEYIILALLIVFLPPLALKMKSDHTLKYLGFSILAIPLIHILFSFLLGWGNLLPFLKIPSLWNII